jgi:small-conductance mechanosensitive channel
MPSFNRLRTTRTSVRKQDATVRQSRTRKIIRTRKRKVKRESAVKGAESRLKNFRQATILAVAITGFVMMVFTPGEAGLAQSTTQEETTDTTLATAIDSLAYTETATPDTLAAQSSKESADEAIGAIQMLWDSFFYNLPKMLIALGILVFAWLLSKGLKWLLHRTLSKWSSTHNAIISLTMIAVWLLAIGIAISVVAGDIRALVGSLGLIGLALSWSLQTPIESFTGWLMNSFQRYYRVGDRIRVGEVFGDVYRIDFLTTTVWEIGGAFQSSNVQAEQPTGRLVTFPNNEILTGTVINVTRDFPFVWDELAIAVANESNMQQAIEVLEGVAKDLLGNYMREPAQQYGVLLKKSGLEFKISEKPQVFISLEDSWTNIIIRYLVGAREGRKWKSELTLRCMQELNKPEYINKIIPVYPRQQVQFINAGGAPTEIEGVIGKQQDS